MVINLLFLLASTSYILTEHTALQTTLQKQHFLNSAYEVLCRCLHDLWKGKTHRYLLYEEGQLKYTTSTSAYYMLKYRSVVHVYNLSPNACLNMLYINVVAHNTFVPLQQFTSSFSLMTNFIIINQLPVYSLILYLDLFEPQQCLADIGCSITIM